MASTDTYRSDAASDIKVHVKPQTSLDDDDGEDLWENDLTKSLPSHNFRSVRGLPSENVIKQGIRRNLKTRSFRSHASVRSRSANAMDNSSISSEVLNEDDVIRDMDLTPEEFAELVKRRKSIKEMPTSITRKRTMRYIVKKIYFRQ